MKGARRMDLTERKKQILKRVVEDYIAAAEPVGSKAVSYTHLDVYKRQGISHARYPSFLLRSEVVVPGVEVRRLVYLRRGGKQVEAADGKIQIRCQVNAHTGGEHAQQQRAKHDAEEAVGQEGGDEQLVDCLLYTSRCV